MSDQSQGDGWWIASDGKWYPPESRPSSTLPPPASGAAPLAPAPSTSSVQRSQWLAVGGGGAGVLGALLPWATVSTAFGSISVAGTSGDGVISLVLAAAGAFLGWQRGKGAIAAGVLGLLVLAIGLYHLSNVEDLADDSGFVIVEAGIGLWLTVGGGACLVVAGLLDLDDRRRERAATPR